MTEQEWLKCEHPEELRRCLGQQFASWPRRLLNWLGIPGKWRPSRKALLCMSACCRRYWTLITWDKRRQAIEAIEQAAEAGLGLVDQETLLLAADTERMLIQLFEESARKRTAYWDEASGAQARAEARECYKAYCGIMRDIYGNPFRPVLPSPAWRTQATIALAQAMYEARRFEDMPLLGDALEEAGCTEEAILRHCREPSGHVRGCWVVDLILGKN